MKLPMSAVFSRLVLACIYRYKYKYNYVDYHSYAMLINDSD